MINVTFFLTEAFNKNVFLTFILLHFAPIRSVVQNPHCHFSMDEPIGSFSPVKGVFGFGFYFNCGLISNQTGLSFFTGRGGRLSVIAGRQFFLVPPWHAQKKFCPPLVCAIRDNNYPNKKLHRRRENLRSPSWEKILVSQLKHLTYSYI